MIIIRYKKLEQFFLHLSHEIFIEPRPFGENGSYEIITVSLPIYLSVITFFVKMVDRNLFDIALEVEGKKNNGARCFGKNLILGKMPQNTQK